MKDEEILVIGREKGLLLEKEIFELLGLVERDVGALFLENMFRYTRQRIITKELVSKNFQYIKGVFNNLNTSEKEAIDLLFSKWGFNIKVLESSEKNKEEKVLFPNTDFSIFYFNSKNDKKIEVKDFVGHFRARYQQLQKILMQRAELTNLISINKIGSERKNMSIIGMVLEKRVTKNGNLIITFEDLTGKIPVLFKVDRPETYSKAQELLFDEVVAIKGSGDRNMLFGYEIFFPDSFVTEKTKLDNDISIAIISDIHCGSIRHLKKSFQNFLYWLNSNDENAKKIKYLFIVGDNIDGVGVFPGQEFSLELKSIKEQYNLLAEYLSQVPKSITMFMCPGQHDAVRLAEPQPIISKEYAQKLYEISNLIMVANPSMIKIKDKNKEFKVLMYHGDSIHDFIREVPELRESKAHKCPARAVKHMLKRRHLFPMHSLSVYIPNLDFDPMVIGEVPDVICTGEVHRLDVETYNGVLIITGSCWQTQTPFEEKVGNIPDPCKVPVINLKTRELKIFDFSVEELNEVPK